MENKFDVNKDLTIKVSVDTTEIDYAIERIKELDKALEGVAKLSNRIVAKVSAMPTVPCGNNINCVDTSCNIHVEPIYPNKPMCNRDACNE